MTMQIGDSFILRIKSLLGLLGLASTAIIAHSDKLHFGENWNDFIVLVCIVLISLNNPIVSKVQVRESDK